MQIELKFSIALEGLPALRRHRLLIQHISSKSRAQQCACIYFDTPDFLLKRHDASLHVMRVSRQWRQTLTVDTSGRQCTGPHRQWVANISEPVPDFSAIAELFEHEPELKRCRFDKSVFSRMVPIFTMDVRRTVWHLGFEQGREAELILDIGEVRSDISQEPIRELTLVQRAGSADAFFDFALTLQHDLDLRVTYLNQMNAGYALHDPVWCGAVSATHLLLHPDTNCEDGMRLVVRSCLSHIMGNAAGVVKDGELECIHQMRVGLRRLRSALEIFEPMKACPAQIQAELAWLSTQLGQARDWDVLNTSTIPSLAARCIDISGLAALQQRVQQEVRRTHRSAAVAVDSRRSTRLWLTLEQWLALPCGAPAEEVSSNETHLAPLMEFADRKLKLLHRKMLKRGAAMVAAPDSRHRLRIASKKLRYATEFFMSFYRRKSADRFLTKLADLQDIFGKSNDTVVADRLLRHLAQKHPDLTEICAYIRGYLAAADDLRLLESGKRTRRFSALKSLQLRDAAA